MKKLRASAPIAARAAALIAITCVLAAAARPTTSTSASLQKAQSAARNRIEARAVNLRNSRGSLRCVLFNSPDGFPRDDDKAVASAAAKVIDGQAACVFTNVAPGSYAIAVLHDENDNKKMDYNFIGIPREGYGFSNDPRVVFKAPTFRAAAFEYRGGEFVVPIRLHYWGRRSSQAK